MSGFELFPRDAWDRRMRALTPDAQRVRLYVMTCPTRMSEGLFRLPVGIIAHDLGMQSDDVAVALGELATAALVLYDDAAETVLDCTALELVPRDKPKDNRIANAVKAFGRVPATQLKLDYYRLAVEHSPALANELVASHPDLRSASPAKPLEAAPSPLEAPSKPLARPSEGATRQDLTMTRPRPDKTRPGDGSDFDSVPDFLSAPGDSPPDCAACGDAALVKATGELALKDGLPWCGWCEPPASS